MSDSEFPPPPPLPPHATAQTPDAEPSGGSLRIGALASTLIGIGGFFIMYWIRLTPDSDLYLYFGRVGDAWLLFTLTLLPLLFVIGAVMVWFSRVRRTGWGVLIGAAVSMLVTTGVCNVALR